MSRAALSVVVPSVNGSQDLDGALAALEAQGPPEQLEVLVVDRVGEDLRESVRRKFPRVKVIPVPKTATIPQMRAIAFDASTADAVAVIEDHVIVPRGWANALLGALNGTRRVVGGSVENAATRTLTDWAAFLCEYSHCMNPLPSGSATWLTGNNVAYPRPLLEQFRPVIAEGAWENRLHDAMRGAGIDLICHPEIAVGHKKHFTVSEYLGQRYLYARSYAGARIHGRSTGARLAYAVAALALPPLLLWRTVSRVVSKRRHIGHLARALPLLGLFVCAWAAGEVVGYAWGPGDSLSRVR